MGAPERRIISCRRCAALAALLGLAARAGAAHAALPAASPEARIDLALLELRIVLALFGLALFVAGVVARRRGRVEAKLAPRRLLLGLVAAAAFAANFNLFVWTGLHRHELYHYYIGSKFFPELGYTGLYVCSVQAAVEDGFSPAKLTEITDLRSKERRPAVELLAASPACRDSFGTERWQAFRSDVAWFRHWMGDELWIGVLRDHGYNPSPAWTLFGRTIASVAPATPLGLWLVAKLDLVLLLAMFAALHAAFGFESACLAAIAWGTCGHTRYQWTGDAFLRQLWMAVAFGGLALLRRGRPAAAGALLAIATLERVFPGAFLLGFGARELCHWLRERRVTPELWRFAIGTTAALLLTASLATWVAGRGLGAWREFGDNTRSMLSFTPRNALGLDYALSFTTVPPPEGLGQNEVERAEIIQDYRRRMLAARRPWRIAGLAASGLLFAIAAWRGAGRRRDGSARLDAWEAAAMGGAIIPFVTMPGSYYVGFVLVGALLATRRWRIGAALLLACAAWSLCLAIYETRAIAFASSSWVLLGYSIWVLGELSFAAADDESQPVSGA